jgi:hypothetical protein
MGAFFSFILGLWMIVAFVSAPYFWAKRTDRSQAPITRRFTAFGYGLAWPYWLYMVVAGQKQKQVKEVNQQAAHDRILGNAAPKIPPTSGKPQPKIQNPFDKQ